MFETEAGFNTDIVKELLDLLVSKLSWKEVPFLRTEKNISG